MYQVYCLPVTILLHHITVTTPCPKSPTNNVSAFPTQDYKPPEVPPSWLCATQPFCSQTLYRAETAFGLCVHWIAPSPPRIERQWGWRSIEASLPPPSILSIFQDLLTVPNLFSTFMAYIHSFNYFYGSCISGPGYVTPLDDNHFLCLKYLTPRRILPARHLWLPLLLLMCIDNTTLAHQNRTPGGQLDPEETSKDIKGDWQPQSNGKSGVRYNRRWGRMNSTKFHCSMYNMFMYMY